MISHEHAIRLIDKRWAVINREKQLVYVYTEKSLTQSSRRKFLWLRNFRPLTPPLMRFRKRRFNQLNIWHASRRSSCSWRLAQMRLVFRCLLLYVPNRYEQAAHIGFRSKRFYMLPSGVHPASSGSLPYSAVFSSVSKCTYADGSVYYYPDAHIIPSCSRFWSSLSILG